MESGNFATQEQSHVEKDVLAAGRAACYKARDVFFNCVEDDSGLTTATEIASAGLLYPKQCKPARASYEQNFRSTWVKQFDRQFCAKKRVKRLLDTGDRTRGPIHAPVNRAGLQPDEH
ncbi:uncharacterized protein [Physcomitrium patens]|uniref:Uncharacterized protein n=1 Tax=Physcomitrium patens TaxID=3218 RepID=A9TI05_PHYPA|nr:uncharacterized protein LOC112274009 [Physcomitrium patens]XP_024358904.1 uncharacterized protein LOC112274009 [Physcomitrium patens]PNR31869.1 hypothetical protein PHYPA_025992 [Physcomitrium patens]|eukprot:XP_024358903.1 uncharacterized protein LOC112274009 [Physcomitrella patens]